MGKMSILSLSLNHHFFYKRLSGLGLELKLPRRLAAVDCVIPSPWLNRVHFLNLHDLHGASVIEKHGNRDEFHDISWFLRFWPT